MSYFSIITKLALMLLIWESILFLIYLNKKRQDLADGFWGLTFIVIAVTTTVFSESPSLPKLILIIMVAIWGLRLSFHIFGRLKSTKEDIRYKEISKNWGKYFLPRVFLQTFLLQGIFALIISLPLISVLNSKNSDINWVIWTFGFLIWAFGIIFESIADYQLKKYLKDQNRSEILDTGLWKYTRHPNYFGEVTLWWGIYIISLSYKHPWYLTLAGPLLITSLILFVSGIPMVEKGFIGNKNYDRYKKRTSVFIPWFQRKENDEHSRFF